LAATTRGIVVGLALSALTACGTGTVTPGAAGDGGLIISRSLALNPNPVTLGQTVTATVTYTNTGATPISLQTIVVAGRPPAGTNLGGPFDDFAPASGALTLNSGASQTVATTRTFTSADPTGGWYAFPTYQDTAGMWHDGPPLSFTVQAPGGSDAGFNPDGGMTLRVSGNTLVDGSGQVIHLRGTNRSGTEYACIQNAGIFDGPNDEASVAAIASWHVRSVRVPLNEDCWLNINGVNPAYGGANYQRAIEAYVALLHRHGMYAELELHWSHAGSTPATGQQPMADLDHSPAFWTSVAAAFKDDPGTFFGTFNEPYSITWACWQNGDSSCSTGYSVAGQQALVDAIRQGGANQPITLSGLDWANTMTSWLYYKPNDPAEQLIAEAHVYGGNTCQSTSCFDSQMKPVAQVVPMIWGEVGEDYMGIDCTSNNIANFLAWADANGVSYQPWTWDTWGNCLSLISDYSGTVNGGSAYASYVQSHLAQLANVP